MELKVDVRCPMPGTFTLMTVHHQGPFTFDQLYFHGVFRIEWNNHPLYMAFKKVLIELIHVLIRITGSQETNWAASIASYSIG